MEFKTALTSFLNINGYDMPCPSYGLEYSIITTVDAGRNVNGSVIGQIVGRDQYKISNINWIGLYPEQRRMILKAIEPFFVPVTFEDPKTGNAITITMYPGDRTGKPLFVDKISHLVTRDDTFSFNLIDCGW